MGGFFELLYTCQWKKITQWDVPQHDVTGTIDIARGLKNLSSEVPQKWGRNTRV